MEATFDTTVAPSAPASAAPPAAPSKTRVRVGRVLSGLACAFLIFDAAMKLVKPEFVVTGSARVGFDEGTIRPLGVILLSSVLLYLWRRTSPLGAALLTAYLGGAVATHVRLGDPALTHTLFPVYFGILVWGGLYLRDARVRALAPWSTSRD